MKTRILFCATVLASVLFAASGQAAAGAPAPSWRIHSTPVPTNFVPGTSGQAFYEIVAENGGGTSTNGGPLTLSDTLPAGVTVSSLSFFLPSIERRKENEAATFCETASVGGIETVTCTVPSELAGFTPSILSPSEQVSMLVKLMVPPTAAGTLVNFARIQGGGAPAAQVASQNAVSGTPAGSGFEAFQAALSDPLGQPVEQAGSHPFQYSTFFALNTKPTPPGTVSPFVPAGGDVKNIEVKLPPGLIGNPMAATRCTNQQFNASETVFPKPVNGVTGSSYIANECPNGSAIGLVVIQQLEGISQTLSAPLYNLVPPPGEPAQLGFRISGASFYIDTSVRTGSDYGITASLHGVSEIRRITGAAVTIWGTPAAASHDSLRGTCLYPFAEYRPLNSLGSCSAGIAPKPFLRLPTSCTTPLTQIMSFDTWNNPGAFVSESSPAGPAVECGRIDYSPSISSRPQVTTADSSSGLAFNLHVPQPELPEGLGTADLKDISVTLPAGVSVNPSSASGLVGCSPGQIELHGPNPAACPEASKIGSVEVHTPLLDHPVKGGVYVATQGDNPFGSLVAIYVAAYDPATGVVLKLAGNVSLDQVTGQITARFTENPQLPFEDLTVEFFNGPRGSLRTPARCGTYTTGTQLTPWSSPESGPDATPSDSFPISSGPGGGPCPNGNTSIGLSAGVQTPIGGTYSPFLTRITREDGSGEIASVDVSAPKGLLAKLAGISYCSPAGIAQAEGRNHLGGGGQESSSPSCPSTSRVGTITVGAGAGPSPYYTGGQVYLAGPYKGAPLSLVAIVPAVAGPFDLGVVTDRIALNVDPETTQVSAVSDPFPTILSGIPLDVRDIRLNLDRPEFALAPTNCTAGSVRATAHGNGGDATASDRFQVGACRGLDYSPKLAISLSGGTTRAKNPALKAVLTQPAGQANISSVSVVLPPNEFIDNRHISNPCTRVEFSAGKCPAKSILGTATAYSPLLEKPLTGPIYFRSNGGERELPDLLVALRGQIDVNLLGFIDSVKVKGREVRSVRTRFQTVPDAPVSKFVLQLKGGKKGLLQNSQNLCKGKNHAKIRMTGQNGKTHDFNPAVQVSCGKSKQTKKSQRRR
jgi:hypothetical protein